MQTHWVVMEHMWIRDRDAVVQTCKTLKWRRANDGILLHSAVRNVAFDSLTESGSFVTSN